MCVRLPDKYAISLNCVLTPLQVKSEDAATLGVVIEILKLVSVTWTRCLVRREIEISDEFNGGMPIKSHNVNNNHTTTQPYSLFRFIEQGLGSNCETKCKSGVITSVIKS